MANMEETKSLKKDSSCPHPQVEVFDHSNTEKFEMENKSSGSNGTSNQSLSSHSAVAGNNAVSMQQSKDNQKSSFEHTKGVNEIDMTTPIMNKDNEGLENLAPFKDPEVIHMQLSETQTDDVKNTEQGRLDRVLPYGEKDNSADILPSDPIVIAMQCDYADADASQVIGTSKIDDAKKAEQDTDKLLTYSGKVNNQHTSDLLLHVNQEDSPADAKIPVNNPSEVVTEFSYTECKENSMNEVNETLVDDLSGHLSSDPYSIEKDNPTDITANEPSIKSIEPNYTGSDEETLMDEANTVLVEDASENHDATSLADNITIDLQNKDFLQQVAGSWSEFDGNKSLFLKGCKWSPDGMCILANCDDNIMRIFNLPYYLYGDSNSEQASEDMQPALKMNEGETIYDFDWYPHMTSYEPKTCCFITTSRDHPIHLWDAFTGKVRCSYLAYNHLDEIIAANSLSFNFDGSKIFAGFNKMVKIFDAARPGRDCEERATFAKGTGFNQTGIISCIASSTEHGNIYALGSFGKTIGVYSEKDINFVCVLKGHIGGLTQVQFSKDGNYLYSGGRKDSNILCWDLRYPGEILWCLKREVETNQRIQFDMHRSGNFLMSGNTNGLISVWDTSSAATRMPSDASTFHSHNDAVNGLSLHPYLPLVASTSGQRHYQIDSSSSEDEGNAPEEQIDNSLRVWRYKLANC